MAGGWPSYLYEFLLFGFKQGWACLFGALMLALLVAHPSVLSAGRLAAALRFPDPGRGRRSSSRLLALPARDLGRGQGDPRLPRRRHRDGAVQDRLRLAGSIRSQPGSGSAACRSSRASCTPRSAPISRGPGGSSSSASAIIRRPGRPDCWRRRSTSISSPITGCPTCAIALLVVDRASSSGARRVWFRPFRRYRCDAAPARLPARSPLFIWFAENIGTLSQAWIYREPAPRLDDGAGHQARSPGIC